MKIFYLLLLFVFAENIIADPATAGMIYTQTVKQVAEMRNQLEQLKEGLNTAKDIKSKVAETFVAANTMYNETFGLIGEVSRLMDEIKDLPNYAQNMGDEMLKDVDCIKATTKGYMDVKKMRKAVYTGRRVALDEKGDPIIDPKTGRYKIIIDPRMTDGQKKTLNTNQRQGSADKLLTACMNKMLNKGVVPLNDGELLSMSAQELLENSDSFLAHVKDRTTAMGALIQNNKGLETQSAKQDQNLNILSQILSTNLQILDVLSRTAKLVAIQAQIEINEKKNSSLQEKTALNKQWDDLGCATYNTLITNFRTKIIMPLLKSGSSKLSKVSNDFLTEHETKTNFINCYRIMTFAKVTEFSNSK